MNQRNIAIGAAVLAAAGVGLALSVLRVPEDKQAIILQLGRPVSTVNTYKPNQSFGETGAGLVLRTPFLQNAVFVDKRIMSLDIPPQTVLSTDQLRLVVDAYARFRVVDPVRMYQTVRTEDRLTEELSRILSSRIRNELGAQRFDALLSPERGRSMDNIQDAVNRSAKAYGAEIIDVRIKRADLPPGTPLEAAFERMRTAREQEALTIRAQGAKNAQIIRAEADAQAARVYAESFGKDPQFYSFYRSMEAYRKSFAQGNSSVVLSPSNEFLREFNGRRSN
ncbi:protease modulator HflC [Sandaracinobacter sp. RS1-74]|uniref:protease modulator HflC n=1 Tax=Sandaracinobacteroides sayramensis TaxID=2913411 RepID=UPI001EDC6939|nr:protease modulator HflC [Sandaracinobacteroides sayramensis]MCG2839990.1 protease modulator HflC [Sandaracinobacteroides sayramensis]